MAGQPVRDARERIGDPAQPTTRKSVLVSIQEGPGEVVTGKGRHSQLSRTDRRNMSETVAGKIRQRQAA
jgi:hypothetical protein